MNERIRELESQCWTQRLTEHGPPWFDSEKFAELIVRDCALIAGLMEHEGRKNIGAAILDRFGVE